MNTFHFSTDWAASLLILASILLLILCFILFFVRRKREKTQPKENPASESVVRDQEEAPGSIEQSEKIPDEEPVQIVLTEKVARVKEIIPLPPVSIKRGTVKPDFRKTFLHPTPFQRRGSVYLSMETKRRIHSVVQRIGEGNLTVTDYVENIMRHHLDLYRDDINRINRTRNFKDLV